MIYVSPLVICDPENIPKNLRRLGRNWCYVIGDRVGELLTLAGLLLWNPELFDVCAFKATPKMRERALENGAVETRSVPVRNAMNEILRDAYIDDNQRGVNRWNKIIRDAGVEFELRLPSRRFNRKMGVHSGHEFDPEGRPLSAEEFEARRDEWLPTAGDKAWVKQLMQPVLERGKMANWLAPPARGIHGRPIDFEYVRRI